MLTVFLSGFLLGVIAVALVLVFTIGAKSRA